MDKQENKTRNKDGRFANGNPGGPGRQNKVREEVRKQILDAIVTEDVR